MSSLLPLALHWQLALPVLAAVALMPVMAAAFLDQAPDSGISGPPPDSTVWTDAPPLAIGPSLEISPATSAAAPLITRSLQFTATRNAKDANHTQWFLIETVPTKDNSSQYTTMSTWLCASRGSAPSVVVAPLVNTVSNGPFPAMDVVGSVQIWAPEFGGQKMGSETSRLAESEQGVWF